MPAGYRSASESGPAFALEGSDSALVRESGRPARSQRPSGLGQITLRRSGTRERAVIVQVLCQCLSAATAPAPSSCGKTALHRGRKAFRRLGAAHLRESPPRWSPLPKTPDPGRSKKRMRPVLGGHSCLLNFDPERLRVSGSHQLPDRPLLGRWRVRTCPREQSSRALSAAERFGSNRAPLLGNSRARGEWLLPE